MYIDIHFGEGVCLPTSGSTLSKTYTMGQFGWQRSPALLPDISMFKHECPFIIVSYNLTSVNVLPGAFHRALEYLRIST